MANKEHLELLKQGVTIWNKWRKSNPEIMPDLSNANLRGANLRKFNLTRVNLAEADLSKAELREARIGKSILMKANLSGADLKRAFLNKANMSQAVLRKALLNRANLMVANLSYADMSMVDLSVANLSLSDLSRANLSDANLIRANFDRANLSEANLRGSNLLKANLSKARLFNTRISEESLNDAIYRPEQLFGMIIEKTAKTRLWPSEQKGELTLKIINSDIPLMNLININICLQVLYDRAYIFLFGQYDNIDDLKNRLESPYHHLLGEEDALKINKISSGSIEEVLLGKYGPHLIIFAFFIASKFPQIIFDLYQCIRKAIYLSEDEKLELEKKKGEIEKLDLEIEEKNISLLDKCRAIESGHTASAEPTYIEAVPTIEPRESPHVSALIEMNRKELTTRSPRIDTLKTVLLLRNMGLLTNKLADKELANLLELISDDSIDRIRLLEEKLGMIEMHIKLER